MRQRLDRPYRAQGGRLQPGDLGRGVRRRGRQAQKAATPDRIGVIAGDLQDAESMKAALDLFTRPRRRRTSTAARTARRWAAGPRESWLFNSTIAGIEQADAMLLVGTNPRLEAPVLNARLRKRWMAGQACRSA